MQRNQGSTDTYAELKNWYNLDNLKEKCPNKYFWSLHWHYIEQNLEQIITKSLVPLVLPDVLGRSDAECWCWISYFVNTRHVFTGWQFEKLKWVIDVSLYLFLYLLMISLQISTCFGIAQQIVEISEDFFYLTCIYSRLSINIVISVTFFQDMVHSRTSNTRCLEELVAVAVGTQKAMHSTS